MNRAPIAMCYVLCAMYVVWSNIKYTIYCDNCLCSLLVFILHYYTVPRKKIVRSII